MSLFGKKEKSRLPIGCMVKMVTYTIVLAFLLASIPYRSYLTDQTLDGKEDKSALSTDYAVHCFQFYMNIIRSLK